MSRRRGNRTRYSTLAFDLNKIKHETRMAMLEIGMEVLEELAERVAEEANANIKAKNIKDDWPKLANQKQRRGPDKSGSSSSGPVSDSVFARPSKNVPTSWLVVAPAWYSHFVEYGTDPHLVIPRGSKRGHTMAFMGTNEFAGRPIAKKEVNHPGIEAPQPFLRPAGDRADKFIDEILKKHGLK